MKNNWSRKKINITKKEAKEITNFRVKEMDNFRKNFLENISGNSDLAMILKYHLYIEKLVNDAIVATVPKPEKLLDNRFSIKIDLIESLNLIDSEIIENLRALNRLRNDFSHNLNKKLVRGDICKFRYSFLPAQKNFNLSRQLHNILSYIVGYLHALIVIMDLFPFSIHQSSFRKIYKKDKAYNRSKILKAYPFEETTTVINELKIDEK